VRGSSLLVLTVLAVAVPAHGQPAPTPEPPPLPPAATPTPAPPPSPPPPPAPRVITADQLAGRSPLTKAERAALREACNDHLPTCDPIALLGDLERRALVGALRRRHLVIDADPAGKQVGEIQVVTMPVFGDEEKIFRWANIFHVSSKEYVIAREVLLTPGQPWSQDKADETLRKLRDPLFTSAVVVVPVVPARGGADAGSGTVDVLVVTRDVFSLRMNTLYEFQDRRFTYLSLSLSENNFLGRRKLVALVFVMNQAAFSLGPLYIDKNFLGKQLEVRARGGPILNRGDFGLEGSESALVVSRPLWSLDSRWGWSLNWSHRLAIERRFVGADLATFDADATPGVDDMLPWHYRQRRWSVGASGVRAWGEGVEHRLKASYDLTSQRPALLDGFPATGAARDEFVAEVLPRNERTGVVSAGYEVYTAHYREYRDVDSFDLGEDVRIGPRAEITVGAGLRLLGSDAYFGRLSVAAGWTLPWARDGVASLSGTWSMRVEDRGVVDRVAATTLRAVSPSTPAGRVVGELRLSGIFRDASNARLELGGDSGLRGYPVNAFSGDRRAVFQAELRTRSVKLLLGLRWGLVGFYDAGAAADTIDQLRLYQDVGFGLRTLTPQLSREPYRFDLAFPLTGPGAGHPRFIAGFQQAF